MKSLTKQFKKLLNRTELSFINSKVSILFLLLVSVIFFFPAFFQNKVALPVDALVGAHIPWTEIKWPDYPAGVPIKNLEITDAFSQFYPWRSLVGNFWRQGKVPLWNNYMFSGTPFLAALHSAALYPLNFVYLLASNINAWNLLVYMQIMLAFVFMFLFLKELVHDNLAAVFGAIAFGFSGYMIAWLEFATGGHAGLWLPLLLFLQLKLFRTKRAIYFFGIPVVLFFILTAGDFQVPFYSLSIYLIFSAFLSYKLKNKLKSFILYSTALFLGLGLSFVQWLPTFELFTKSIRANDPYIQEYFYGIFHWEKIVNFIWPDFFGNVVTGNYWGKFGYHEYLAFCGATTIALFIFSLVSKKTSMEKFFVGVLAVALLFLFPTPIAFLPYKLHIPGLGTSSASRILFLIGFCLSTLGAFGFSKINKQNIDKLIKVLLYLLVVTLGVVIGISVSLAIFRNSGLNVTLFQNLKVSIKNIIPSTGVLVFLLVIAWVYQKLDFSKTNFLKLILCLILTVEMFRFAWKNTPFSEARFVFPDTKTTSFLKENADIYRISGGIPLNLFMPYEIKSLEGYDPIYPAQNSEWYSLINAGDLSALSGRYGLVHNFGSPLLNISSVKYVVDYKKNPLGQLSDKGVLSFGIAEPKYKEVFAEGRVKTFENNDVLPLAWATNNYSVVKTDNEIIPKLFDDNVVHGRMVLLDEVPKIESGSENLDYKVNNLIFGENEVSLSVNVNKAALLFLSQSYDKGWKVYVNNEEVKIYRADYLYQAIDLPEGGSDVHFVYFPKSFKIGLEIFFATILILLLLVAILRNKEIII